MNCFHSSYTIDEHIHLFLFTHKVSKNCYGLFIYFCYKKYFFSTLKPVLLAILVFKLQIQQEIIQQEIIQSCNLSLLPSNFYSNLLFTFSQQFFQQFPCNSYYNLLYFSWIYLDDNMFKGNPHYNEYYGLIHQSKNPKKKLKRTQFSGQKLGSSKKSFSQDSRSDVEIHPYNNNANLPNFKNKKNGESHKTHNCKPHKIEDAIGQNILDQFKIFKPEKQERVRTNQPTHSKQNSKKFIGIDTQDQESSNNISRNQRHKLSLGDYFGDSVDPRHIKFERNISKSKSHKSRQSRSPLRKILKSKSRQQIDTPVQKMNNIIKLEQKLKQRHVQNEKTLKHINYYKTLNELNQTYLNEVSHKLKEVRSEKKLHLRPKMTLHHQGSREIYRSAMQQRYSAQKIIQSMLKRVKSDKSNQMNMKQLSRGKPKMSTQKIKQYFLNKEQNERKHQKMKGILENIKANNHIQQKLRKVKSEEMLPQMRVNFDEQSQVSNWIASYSKRPDERQFYTQKKNPYNGDDSSQIKQRSSLLQYSDYGFQFENSPQKGKKNKFQKSPHHNVSIQRSQNKIQEQDSGGFIDTGKSFGQSKLNQLQKDSSDIYEVNSVASIEERFPYKILKKEKSNLLESQRSIGSRQCIINVRSPQKSDLSQAISINTPAHRKKTDKKPKQSIISKLKKDIAEDKLKSSKRSKLSSSKVLKRNSSISKKSPQPILTRSRQKLKIQKHQQKQESDYLSSSNHLNDQQRSSKMNQFSNLIHSASPSHYNKSTNQGRNQYQKQQDPSKGKQSPMNVQGNYFNQIESEKNIDMSKKSSDHSQNTENLHSMINSNKSGPHKNSQKESNRLKNFQIHLEQVSDNSEASSPITRQIKTPVKLIKVLKRQERAPFQIPKIEESNLNEMTDSNPTFSESANSSQSSPFLSNSSMSQSARMLKNSTSKNIKNDKNMANKPKAILEEQISECQSQSLQLSVNMSSSGSQPSKELSRKDRNVQSRNKAKVQSRSQRQESMSSSGQSPANTNLQTSSFTSSQKNLNIDSKSSFSVSNSNTGSSQLLKNQSKKLGFNTINNHSTSFKKKKNFAEYTLNDVARFIQQHEFRIEAYCVYIDNCRQIYQEDYQLQKTQLLSFLMLKKNLFQLHRTIAALQGKGENVFDLTDIQILDEVLEDYLDRSEIKQQLKNLISEQKSTKQQFLEMYASLEKKYSGEKGFSLSLQKDDFSYEIVKRLGQQLNLLYQKWQKNKSDGNRKTANMLGQKYEKRMVQIIELIFLTSELDGKKVKTCQLICEKDPEFRPYYEKWFEGIIQTIEYFDSKQKNYSSSS